MPSLLYLVIFGGNRMIGYNSPLDITAETKDPDVGGGLQN